MQLEKMYSEALESRENSVIWASEQVSNLSKNHIVKGEDGFDSLDYESFSEEEKHEYDFQSRNLEDYRLKAQLFREYIRENSGMDFDTVFLRPTEKLISSLLAKETSGNFLSDVVDTKTNERFVVIMGQHFSNKVFEGKTPQEIKEIYFAMITQAMEKNGFTQEQIDECIKNIAISMGGKEKTSSLNM